MTGNLGQAIGAGVGLLVTAKIAGKVISEVDKFGKVSEKDIPNKQSEIKSLP